MLSQTVSGGDNGSEEDSDALVAVIKFPIVDINVDRDYGYDGGKVGRNARREIRVQGRA